MSLSAAAAPYARAFLPMLRFNAGASDLAAIVSDMAKAGRDAAKNPEDWRGVDAVALGFMMEIGGSLQAAMVGMAVAPSRSKSPLPILAPSSSNWLRAAKRCAT
jgi:hypothetical protein